MEDYIRKGVAAHSSMASPVAVQPIYDSQGHVIHSPPRLNRAQVSRSGLRNDRGFAADKSADGGRVSDSRSHQGYGRARDCKSGGGGGAEDDFSPAIPVPHDSSRSRGSTRPPWLSWSSRPPRCCFAPRLSSTPSFSRDSSHLLSRPTPLPSRPLIDPVGPPGVSIYEGPSEDAEEDKDTGAYEKCVAMMVVTVAAEEATVSGKDKKQGKASESPCFSDGAWSPDHVSSPASPTDN
eukprot:748457-Hanusia_phi.AAC.3